MLSKSVILTNITSIQNCPFFSRENPFSISVFLDKFGQATGEVFFDDGDSLKTYERGLFTNVKFVAAGPSKKKKKMGRFRSRVVRNGYQVFTVNP